MVRDLDDNADFLALLLDAFEDAIEHIQSSTILVERIKKIKSDNDQTKDEISDFSFGIRKDLSELFKSMGITTEFTSDEQDKIDDFVENYNHGILERLSRLSQNDDTALKMLYKLTNPPKNIQDIIAKYWGGSKKDDDDLF